MNDYNKNLNTSDWKKINIEYLDDYISLKVPPVCETLQLEPTPALAETKKEIENAFENPVNSRTIDEIIANQSKPTGEITVAIAVSDNTRPVPYHCEDDANILSPILTRLERTGIRKENIKIIIGTGNTCSTSSQWKKRESFWG